MGFLMGIMLTPWFLGALLIVAVAFEYFEHSFWSLFMAGGFIWVAKVMYGLTLGGLVYVGLAYLVIGAIWSYFRWTRYCSQVFADYKESSGSTRGLTKDRALNRIKVSHNKARLVGWFLNWPISVVIFILSDMLAEVATAIWNFGEMVIMKVFHGLYVRVSDKTAAKIHDLDEA